MPLAPDIQNLLLGLAWLGELNRQQIARLWFLDKSVSTVEKTLTQLRKDNLLQCRSWSIHDEVRGVTVPQLAQWSLSSAGHDIVKTSAQYPLKPVRPRPRRLIGHDARTREVIVRLIEWARPHGLCGLFVGHEIRLDPRRTRPVCDALVVLQIGPHHDVAAIPWSNDPAIEDETRYRYAIEADNATEPPEVIRGKGYAYRGVREDPAWDVWWRASYGPPPIPLWVVPSHKRLEVVQQQWCKAWPSGVWLITDDTGLAQNRWLGRSAAQETLGCINPRSLVPLQSLQVPPRQAVARVLGGQAARSTAPIAVKPDAPAALRAVAPAASLPAAPQTTALVTAPTVETRELPTRADYELGQPLLVRLCRRMCRSLKRLFTNTTDA